MSGVVREENIRVRIQALSELPEVADQLETLVKLTLQQQEITRQAALSARTGSIQQVDAIQGITQALKEQQSQQKKTDDEGSNNRKKASSELDDLSKQVRNFATLVATAFTFNEIKQFAFDVIEAKTSIDSVKLSLDTMLGSKRESAELYSQIVTLAKTTPFTLQEVSEQVVKLKAYNIATDELIPTITALGNISAAVGKEKLPQLTLAYGQVANAGKLMGTELRQFTEAGVPLLDLIATAYGKTKDAVVKMAADHEISFAMVKKALMDASEEGGKYAGLMEKMSKTVGGAVSNLEDTFFVAKGRIGDFFEKEIRGGTSILSDMIEALAGSNSAINRTIDIVKSAAAAFVTYTVATKAQQVADVAIAAITATKNVLYGEYLLAMRAMTAQQVVFTAAETEAVVAAQSFNLALSNNPIGLVVTVLGTLVTAFYAFKAVNDEVISSMGEQEIALKTEKSELDALTQSAMAAGMGTKERKDAIDLLIKKYPDYFAGINSEKVTNDQLRKILDDVNASYQTRISLARQAYNLEGLAAKQKELFEFEKNFFEGLPKDIGDRFNNDITKFNAALNAGTAASAKLKEQLNDFAPGGAEFFGGVAKNAADKFKTVEDSYTKLNTNMQKSDSARIEAAVAAENSRWEAQLANLDKGTKAYREAEQKHLDNLAKINGTYRENEIKDTTDHAEKLKSVTLVSAKEIALIKAQNDQADEQNRIKQLKDQLDYLNKQEDAEIESINKVKVNRKISNDQLAALQEEGRQKIAEIDRKYDLQRAQILEQIEAEEQKKYLEKIQDTNDKVAVLTAKRLEAEKMLTMLNDAKTSEERLAALKVYNEKYAESVKESVAQQMKIQLDAAEDLLAAEAEKTGERGKAYREAYDAWLKAFEAYNKAVKDQTETTTKETAETIKKYEQQIQEAKKETARIDKDTLEEQKQNRQQFLTSFASFISQQTGLIGQFASGLIGVYNGLDQLQLKALDNAKGLVESAQNNLSVIKGMYSDGTAEGAAAIAGAEKSLAESKNKLEVTKGEAAAGVLSIMSTIYQVFSAIANAYNEHQRKVYQAVADGFANIRQAYSDLYAFIDKAAKDAHDEEMKNFTGGIDEKLKKIDEYYAREKQYAEGRDRIDAMLAYYQQAAQIQADAGTDAGKIMKGLTELARDQIKMQEQMVINQAELQIAKARETRDAQIQNIDEALQAFKDAKQQEIDAENAALAAQKAANEQFYSDKQLRLQNDDVYRTELLNQGEAREIKALEDARDRELKRAEESNATAEEVARIKNAFELLITEKHAEYADARGNKEKEISLANQETKAQEKDHEQELEVGTANAIQKIMEEMAKQEAKAAEDRARSNAEYANQVMQANRAIFEANKRMKIAELQAEIAVLEGQKGLFSNNSAINAAIDALNQAIGTISGLSYDTGSATTSGISSVFGKTNIVKEYITSTSPGGSPSGNTGASKPTTPIDGSNNAISVAYDENGNEIILTYDSSGHSFDAYDVNRNAISVRYAKGYAPTTNKRYFQGTPYLELGANPAGRDTIPVLANEGERILPTSDNIEIGGKSLSNRELINKVKFYDQFIANLPDQVRLQMIMPGYAGEQLRIPDNIMQMSNQSSVDMSGVVKELRETRQTMKSLKQLHINMDERGFTKTLVSGQSKTSYYSTLFQQ